MPAIQRIRIAGLLKKPGKSESPLLGGGDDTIFTVVCQTIATAPPRIGCAVSSPIYATLSCLYTNYEYLLEVLLFVEYYLCIIGILYTLEGTSGFIVCYCTKLCDVIELSVITFSNVACIHANKQVLNIISEIYSEVHAKVNVLLEYNVIIYIYIYNLKCCVVIIEWIM